MKRHASPRPCQMPVRQLGAITDAVSAHERQFPMLQLFLLAAAIVQAEPDRPKMPPIAKPVVFNTKEADAILRAMQVLPPDSPWNEDIAQRPVAANSKQMIGLIGANGRLAYNLDMAFVIVPPDQKKVRLRGLKYPDESDKGPFPI